MVIFVLADFDPAGHQMAVSIGRKLQALRDVFFPNLRFEVVEANQRKVLRLRVKRHVAAAPAS